MDPPLSIWMPVDPVPLESSVKFVRGSHRWGKWFHPRKFASERNYPVESEEYEGKTFLDVPVADIESGKYEASLSVNKLSNTDDKVVRIDVDGVMVVTCQPQSQFVTLSQTTRPQYFFSRQYFYYDIHHN